MSDSSMQAVDRACHRVAVDQDCHTVPVDRACHRILVSGLGLS